MRQWTWIAAVALVGLLGWQTWAIVSLRREVSELRGERSPGAGAEATGRKTALAESRPGDRETRRPVHAGRLRTPVSATRAAGRDSTGPKAAEDAHRSVSDQQALEQAIERTLKRMDQARFEKRSWQWLRAASDRIDRTVGEFVDEGRVPERAREQVADVLRNQIYFTWQIKDDVRTGTLDEADALAQYEAQRANMVTELTGLVDQETAADLLGRVENRGGK